MTAHRRPLLMRASACWNWKCALLSTAARSLVYLAAMVRSGLHGGVAVVLVEIAYVSLTAGIYAGMQQRALGLRWRWLGNLIVVIGVPVLAQILDWRSHILMGAPASARATLDVSIFAAISALFHLYIMRNGVLRAGTDRSLGDDFRRMPRLVADLVTRPAEFVWALVSRPAGSSEAAFQDSAPTLHVGKSFPSGAHSAAHSPFARRADLDGEELAI